jgi:hypothetical protein
MSKYTLDQDQVKFFVNEVLNNADIITRLQNYNVHVTDLLVSRILRSLDEAAENVLTYTMTEFDATMVALKMLTTYKELCKVNNSDIVKYDIVNTSCFVYINSVTTIEKNVPPKANYVFTESQIKNFAEIVISMYEDACDAGKSSKGVLVFFDELLNYLNTEAVNDNDVTIRRER